MGCAYGYSGQIIYTEAEEVSLRGCLRGSSAAPSGWESKPSSLRVYTRKKRFGFAQTTSLAV